MEVPFMDHIQRKSEFEEKMASSVFAWLIWRTHGIDRNNYKVVLHVNLEPRKGVWVKDAASVMYTCHERALNYPERRCRKR